MKTILKILLGTILSIFVLILALLGLSYRPDIPPEELLERYTDTYSKFIEVEGVKMHIRLKGSGEPILLVHGSFASLHTWQAWEEVLSQNFTTISVDLPGHGLTGPDSLKRYGIADYAKLLLSLADQLELETFHIAGNSMGGAVAMQVASDQPARVKSLGLLNAAGVPAIARESVPTASTQSTKKSSFSIFTLARSQVFSKVLLKCTPRFLFEENLSQVFYDTSKITNAMLDRYYLLLRRSGNRAATIERLTTKKLSNISFGRLKMPTLILWGKHDRWIPVANGHRLKGLIPQAELVVFPNAGHVPMEEIPNESVAAYLAFLQKTASP